MLKEKVKYAFYTITHPSNGFYEIRHRQKGSVPLAILFVFLFAVCFSANRQYAGFVVNFINPMEVNSLTEMMTVFVLFILFCAGNWSVTCLMNGEGRFKDIVTMTGYSILPMILTQIPAIIISNFVVQDEEAYYYLILYFGIAWFVLLVITGVMTIHNYTFGKTLITLICTFVAMFIIIFIALLLYSLLTQVIAFVQSVYNEIVLRM